MIRFSCSIFALLFVFASLHRTCAAEITLVESGIPAVTVAIAAESPGAEAIPGGSGKQKRDKLARLLIPSDERAAHQLIETLQTISGANVALEQIDPNQVEAFVAKTRGEGKTPVLIGKVARILIGKLPPEAEKAFKDPSSFLLRATPGAIAIAGATETGTGIGVQELLEQLGVRWFFPGKLGTVIPSDKTVKINTQETVQRPTFEARQFQINGDLNRFWAVQQRQGGFRFPNAHGIPLAEGVSFQTNPELYALVNGVRRKPQICISNPEVLRQATESVRNYFRNNPDKSVFGIGPADGRNFCECDQCRAMDAGDWDPFASELSMTDRYITFFNRILDNIHDEFPDKKLAFYIYAAYMRPPVKVTPNPRIIGAVAPIALCRVHGLRNPVCPERSYLQSIVGSWTKLLPEVYERGYWFNLADPGALFVQTDRLKDEIDYHAAHGTRGFRTECIGEWAAEGPSLYIAGKLMWNAKADPEALLTDFCDKLFGPAATPMRAYFAYLDERLKNVDHHVGGAFNLLQFYPSEVRAKAGQFLAEAKALANASPERDRVEIFARGFEYTDHFVRMLEARNRYDWSAAHAELQKMTEIGKMLVTGYDVPMLSNKGVTTYLNRFFRLTVEQGHAKSADGNRVVANLSDEWEFLMDPMGVGSSLGYERANLTGGDWIKAPSFSIPWGDLGMRYYKGLAWYRQTVEVPPEAAGKRVFLWLGSVDETARVWINGQPIGNSPRSPFTPFELDATKALKAGRNLITICVANQQIDELGTGGIMAPGFFYHPAAGEAAVLENVRDLKETFP